MDNKFSHSNLSPSSFSGNLKPAFQSATEPRNGSKPKTVREWAEKNIHQTTDAPIMSSLMQSDSQMQSSLMKKAQEKVN